MALIAVRATRIASISPAVLIIMDVRIITGRITARINITAAGPIDGRTARHRRCTATTVHRVPMDSPPLCTIRATACISASPNDGRSTLTRTGPVQPARTHPDAIVREV